jgi:hypothetical protein
MRRSFLQLLGTKAPALLPVLIVLQVLWYRCDALENKFMVPFKGYV